jgi:hypothetical protein
VNQPNFSTHSMSRRMPFGAGAGGMLLVVAPEVDWELFRKLNAQE